MKKKKSAGATTVIMITLIILIIALGAYIINELAKYAAAKLTYDEVADEMISTDVEIQFDDESDEDDGIYYFDNITIADINYLQSINPDVVGWIQIPGTAVNYPVVHSEDEEFYLHHLYTGEYSSSGSIFVEPGITDYLDNRNCIIYGHNMRNGTMFQPLNNYSDKSYFEEHPYILMTDTDGTIYVYSIFSVYRNDYTNVDYRYNFGASDTFQLYLDRIKGRSIYETGVTADRNDHCIMLSTCSGLSGTTMRMLIHAKRSGIAVID